MTLAAACPVCDTPRAWAADASVGRCESCQALVFPPAAGPKVLIGHDSDDVSADLGSLLTVAGFCVLRATQGTQAMQLALKHRPRGACLDVGLGEISMPEVIEKMHAAPELAGIRIIIVASVFNKAAYKRRPGKLYGADDYIEHHQAAALLPQKLGVLLGFKARTTSATVAATPEAPGVVAPRSTATLLRVRALALSIVADVALSHQDAVAVAVDSGNMSELAPALDEGRRLLAEMVAREDFESDDPIGAAFTTFIEDLRRVKR